MLPGVNAIACSVCGSPALETLLDLPHFPITGLHAHRTDSGVSWEADQELRHCLRCDHAQLLRRIDREVLYGPQFGFHTAGSPQNRAGVDALVRFSESIRPIRGAVFEIGCNDLTLLRSVQSRASRLVGIDPIWRFGKDQWYGTTLASLNNEKTTVIGDFVERLDLRALFPAPPDVVFMRHTLEHLEEPRVVLSQLLDVSGPETLFVVETTDRDELIRTLRFDRITHHSLHYFSSGSLDYLIASLGCRALARAGGRVAFAPGTASQIAGIRSSAAAFRDGFRRFKAHLALINEALTSFGATPLYGFGGGNFLPALLYHLGAPLPLRAILEDDAAKDGIFYVNVPTPIWSVARVPNLTDVAVFVTAVNYQRAIAARLAEARPRAIVLPLPVC